MASILRNTLQLFEAPIFTDYSVLWIGLVVAIVAFSPLGKYVFKGIKFLINSIAYLPAILSGVVGANAIYYGHSYNNIIGTVVGVSMILLSAFLFNKFRRTKFI